MDRDREGWEVKERKMSMHRQFLQHHQENTKDKKREKRKTGREKDNVF